MITFPSSPSNAQTFLADDGITYQYNTSKNLWVRMITGTGGGGDGYTGSRGYIGSASTASGVTGYTGSRGNIGYTGSVGYTGSQGDLGYSGSRGYTGSTGTQGNVGFVGSQGSFAGNADQVIITNATASTSYSSGALIVTGGAGIRGIVNIAGFSVGTGGYYPSTVDYLVVGGGGGSGNDTPGWAGGGGAGGLYYSTTGTVSTGSTYVITIGSGGAPSANGLDSVAFGKTALGGGAGGVRNTTRIPGSNGGSGGGGGSPTYYGNFDWPAGTGLQSTSTSGGYGFDGSPGNHYNYGNVPGNGGGAGGAATSDWTSAGSPGTGRLYSQFGMFGTDASNSSASTSGKGYFAGGGKGGAGAITVPGGGGITLTNGAPNTGGGGGGGPRNGGSGIIIIQYPDTYDATVSTGNPTVVVTGGYRIYAFTQSGTITFSPEIFTPSTSTTTGALVVIGGVGIGQNLTVGGTLTSPQQTKANNSSGTVGQICWDANYIYVCTATDTWKRAALTGGY